MSKSIGVIGVNPGPSPRPYKWVSWAEANDAVRWKRARWVSRSIIREIQRGFWDGRLGTGNALPFSRVQNKLTKPKPLHYEIPACGAPSWLNGSAFWTNHGTEKEQQ